eukprot:CAMPEP_0197649568 /NCGR_PEP_ID=MMETSP1338-20131121/28878_1 /TAXON_ID=43686 ORGANISM="Pelagodinium beii, Strain RCC1491" /NCGR_SAMPLE_ID=MMETSP1338 /ASSEMBLY_ACC=CAM_ASM_000754 /LENGTH=90 /DNA_ID=CAMNT_0043223795 /DNA_START=62 /DNA_END=334 /DNA_ORIENTATION=-
MATERKVQIKNADMSDTLQTDVVECAKTAMDRYNTEKDIANFVKKELDKMHSPFWHVICGRNFGSYVTHETKHFIYFYIDELAVLAFKAG